MLPQSLLLFSSYPQRPQGLRNPGDRTDFQAVPHLNNLVPHYFNERDYPWVNRYLEEFTRCIDKKRRDLITHMCSDLPFDAPKKKSDLLFHILCRLSLEDPCLLTGKKARELRKAIFLLAAESTSPDQAGFDVKSVITKVANDFQLKSESLFNAAFSDLLLERKFLKMPENLNASEACLRANLALAQSLISRSSSIEIQASGEVRRIVRQAKLRKLICEVEIGRELNVRESSMSSTSARGIMNGVILKISGPLSLFGHTLVYGRALSEMVPLLSWCQNFKLTAVCRVRGKEGVFSLRSGDPIFPSTEPKHYDSLIEKQFSKDFLKHSLDWDLIRESEPILLENNPSGKVIFPDFKIQHSRDPRLHCYMEIAGFWTRDYLEKKIDQLYQARLPNLIICVNENLLCDKNQDLEVLLKLGHVVLYKRRIPVVDVMNAIQRFAIQSPVIKKQLGSGL